MKTNWTLDESELAETYYRDRRQPQFGYVSAFGNSMGYHWQAVRGEYRLSGSEQSANDAMDTCDKFLALSVEEFNELVAAKLIFDLKEVEHKLRFLQPNTELLPGYHSGYEAGYLDARRKVMSLFLDAEQ